jgi:hypothetical protein
VLLGFTKVKKDPNVKLFLSQFIEEMNRLCFWNTRESEIENHPFTVSLRVIIADPPMRSYLKRTKYHQGFFNSKGIKVNHITRYEKVDAPRRTDDLFLSYHSTSTCDDEHIVDPSDQSLRSKTPWHLLMLHQGLSVKKIRSIS